MSRAARAATSAPIPATHSPSVPSWRWRFHASTSKWYHKSPCCLGFSGRGRRDGSGTEGQHRQVAGVDAFGVKLLRER